MCSDLILFSIPALFHANQHSAMVSKALHFNLSLVFILSTT